MAEEQQVSKYDRVRGGLDGVALFTKPTTIRSVQSITGKAETYVVETGRHPELGDTIFVECVDENGVARLALPPKVADAISRQRDALTARTRSRAAQDVARARKERGELPGFMHSKRKKD